LANWCASGGANAGGLIRGEPFYHETVAQHGAATVREMEKLSERSQTFWRSIASQANVPIRECGSLLLAESAEEQRELEAAVRAAEADGIEVLYHDHDPLGRGYLAAMERPRDAAIQPYELVKAIFAASGAEFIANNELYKLEAAGANEVWAYTRHYRFKSRQILLCTNAYSVNLDPYFAGKIIPTRAQCLVTEPLPEHQRPLLTTIGISDYGSMYYRETFDGRLLLGGGRRPSRSAERDTTEDRVSASVQESLDAYLQERFPDVTVPVSRRWAGILGLTPDGLPVVGALPHLPNVYFCIACNCQGLTNGAGAAERAVDHLLTGASLGPLDVKRLQ
jgi:glycine/D-amino acid oxidase-like deaminating enzyme